MNGPKPLSAGEGGFVLTNDENVHARLLLHGQYNTRCKQGVPQTHPLWKYRVTGMGLKLRLHPLAAAIALQQLGNLDGYIAGRRNIADQITKGLQGVPGIAMIDPPEGVESSGYAACLLYNPDECDGTPASEILAALHAEECVDIDQPGSTRPLNNLPLFQDPHGLFPHLPDDWPTYQENEFPRAQTLWENTLKFTISHHDTQLTNEYIEAITKVMNHYARRNGN